jgi:hypothetical protein
MYKCACGAMHGTGKECPLEANRRKQAKKKR